MIEIVGNSPPIYLRWDSQVITENNQLDKGFVKSKLTNIATRNVKGYNQLISLKNFHAVYFSKKLFSLIASLYTSFRCIRWFMAKITVPPM